MKLFGAASASSLDLSCKNITYYVRDVIIAGVNEVNKPSPVHRPLELEWHTLSIRNKTRWQTDLYIISR